MHVEQITLNSSNKFLTDYYSHKSELMDHFDYKPYSDNVFKQRVSDLKEMDFEREDLADVLEKLNYKWGASPKTLENIIRLKEPESVVVIGGQQAGLLGGPLYTIHKIISILHLAKEQESKLNIPVIPVFWIAGEDHDYDEINHIYLPEETKMQKLIWKDKWNEKMSISGRELKLDQGMTWLNNIFSNLEETSYSKALYQKVKHIMNESDTIVDFFARFIHELFRDTGIVLIDSGDQQVRQLEKKYFKALIENQAEFSKGVFQCLQSMRMKRYHVSVDVEEDDGHLFYHHNGQRILLKRDGTDWVGKNEECRLSHKDMLEIADKQPQLLSNNVVTRPVMQESLFPTLAFLGGTSEVAYWSILKPVFQSLNMKMPPVLPRMSITIVERKIQKLMDHFAIKLEEVITHGVTNQKQYWLESQSEPPVDLLTAQVKQMIASAHNPLVVHAKQLKPDVGQYAEKNLQYILDHVEQLTKRMKKEIESKYDKELNHFNNISMHFKPEEGLQERTWNIIYYLNNYGPEFMKEIISQDYKMEGGHQVVYL
ncbi:bacillithiol biosynthesis cysteine-adding enzyme BshC [Gracilibacillus oryzae]|uniref:Putative cysteine ligase BshC n=1 Tax=Gracilibacillus oryzae TaxID=1672701 RepID=A0A7C8GUV1_9BACI|nr:bacillithiol biosynthesis cysteine-adding enzyme BshC [Gracilibacillus oryzae]KAB8138643.1 bacillithiol biosynthesis cysteine-adding enzyme BshC [Gracilibacillus oryzae]